MYLMTPLMKRARRLLPRLLLSFTVFVLLIALAEGGAYLADQQFHFRDKLLNTLLYLEPASKPRSLHEELHWQNKALYIRGKGPHEEMERVVPKDLHEDGKKHVFVIGGSAAFGHNLLFDEYYGNLVSKNAKNNAYNFHVAAQVGWPSAKIVLVARRIIDFYDCNILVIYSGNNEWRHFKDFPNLIDLAGLAETLRNFRRLSFSHLLSYFVYRHLKDMPAQIENQTKRPEGELDWSIGHPPKDADKYLEYALRNPARKYYPFDGTVWQASKKAHLNAFKNNLREIVQLAETRNIKVILMSVPFNYRLSPAYHHPQPEFYSSKNRTLVQNALIKAPKHIEAGEYRQALLRADRALKAEPLIPVLHYIRGWCLERLGRHLHAEKAYELSREYTVGILGSRLSINRVIREVARETHSQLIDLKEHFDKYEHQRGRYYNERLVSDDCHPSAEANELIAKLLTLKLHAR